jgi:hypothetical protein
MSKEGATFPTATLINIEELLSVSMFAFNEIVNIIVVFILRGLNSYSSIIKLNI